jgi:hypothetical protein
MREMQSTGLASFPPSTELDPVTWMMECDDGVAASSHCHLDPSTRRGCRVEH